MTEESTGGEIDKEDTANETGGEASVQPSPRKTRSMTASSSVTATSSQDEGTPQKSSTPRKARKTKAELKEQLMKQKVCSFILLLKLFNT